MTPRPIEGGQDPHSKARLPTPPELARQTVDPARVTFRHLLTHTSGLPPWRDVYNAAGDAPSPPDQPMTADARAWRWRRGLASLNTYPFVAPPDGVVRYSDIGLMLLGEAVARLDGGDLEAAIRRRVIDRLGGTGDGRTGQALSLHNIASAFLHGISGSPLPENVIMLGHSALCPLTYFLPAFEQMSLPGVL